MIFCNVVYVCEMFAICWWSFSWLGQSNPVVWHMHCVGDCPNDTTGRFEGKQKDSFLILFFPVQLPYDERNGILQSQFRCKPMVPFMVAMVLLDFSTLRLLSE